MKKEKKRMCKLNAVMQVTDVSVLISGDTVAAGQQRHHEPAEPEPGPEP